MKNSIKTMSSLMAVICFVLFSCIGASAQQAKQPAATQTKQKIQLEPNTAYSVAPFQYNGDERTTPPDFKTPEEKAAWYKAQAAKNQQAPEFKAPSAEIEQPKSVVKDSKTIVIYPQEPSFPKYIDTGNPEADQARYDEAKSKWVSENPMRYKQLQQESGNNR